MCALRPCLLHAHWPTGLAQLKLLARCAAHTCLQPLQAATPVPWGDLHVVHTHELRWSKKQRAAHGVAALNGHRFTPWHEGMTHPGIGAVACRGALLAPPILVAYLRQGL